MLTINKSTRATKKTAKAIDHILTNHFIDVNFTTKISKTDISDHFPVWKLVENKYTYVYKRVITEHTEHFNQAFYESDWAEIETCNNPSECYKSFF